MHAGAVFKIFTLFLFLFLGRHPSGEGSEELHASVVQRPNTESCTTQTAAQPCKWSHQHALQAGAPSSSPNVARYPKRHVYYWANEHEPSTQDFRWDRGRRFPDCMMVKLGNVDLRNIQIFSEFFKYSWGQLVCEFPSSMIILGIQHILHTHLDA